MNKLILAFAAALVAGSALAADAPTKPTLTPGCGRKVATAPNTAIKAHHHSMAYHHKAGKRTLTANKTLKALQAGIFKNDKGRLQICKACVSMTLEKDANLKEQNPLPFKPQSRFGETHEQTDRRPDFFRFRRFRDGC